MKRSRVLNCVSAVSLLLCIAMTALWVRGYAIDDSLIYENVRSGAFIGLRAGKIVLSRFWIVGSADTFAAGRWLDHVREPSDMRVDCPYDKEATFFLAALIEREPTGYSPAYHYQYVTFHAAFIVILLLLCPLRVLWRIAVARRNLRVGRCAVCSYDLRGNVSGVCPECGGVVSRNAKVVT